MPPFRHHEGEIGVCALFARDELQFLGLQSCRVEGAEELGKAVGAVHEGEPSAELQTPRGRSDELFQGQRKLLAADRLLGVCVFKPALFVRGIAQNERKRLDIAGRDVLHGDVFHRKEVIQPVDLHRAAGKFRHLLLQFKEGDVLNARILGKEMQPDDTAPRAEIGDLLPRLRLDKA